MSRWSGDAKHLFKGRWELLRFYILSGNLLGLGGSLFSKNLSINYWMLYLFYFYKCSISRVLITPRTCWISLGIYLPSFFQSSFATRLTLNGFLFNEWISSYDAWLRNGLAFNASILLAYKITSKLLHIFRIHNHIVLLGESITTIVKLTFIIANL